MSDQAPTGWEQAGTYPVPQQESPYGQPLGPPPDYRKKRVWPWVLGLFMLLLAMLGACGAAIVGGIFYLTRGPINATNSFVANIDDGDLDAAYDSLCGQTRVTLTRADFDDDFAFSDQITGYTFSSVSTATGELTVVSGTIEIDGSPQAVSFGLRRDEGDWKICTYDDLS